jgi:phosphoribosylformylglycinamidine synthase
VAKKRKAGKKHEKEQPLASHRIEVGIKKGQNDAPSKGALATLKDSGLSVDDVRVLDVFTVEKLFERPLGSAMLQKLARELFSNKIVQEFSTAVTTEQLSRKGDFDWAVEVYYQPGAKDSAGEAVTGLAEKIMGEHLQQGEAVYTSKLYLIKGDVDEEQLESAVRENFANETVEGWTITPRKSYPYSHNVPSRRVELDHEPQIKYLSLNISTNELMGISNERKLALNPVEMQKIQGYFSTPERVEKRKEIGFIEPEKTTDAELELLGQSWSEHCKHKIFNAKIQYNGEIIDSIFRTYIKNAVKKLEPQFKDKIVSTLWDNSGVIRFDDDWLFCFKTETHNSPSQEYPHGGAITGIVGVYRDPMGTGIGGRMLYGGYGFCTGSPFYDGNLAPKIHPRKLLEGIRGGVQDGGNMSGVPTPIGFVHFDDGFIGKPAVFVTAGAMIPAVGKDGKPGWEKEAKVGDLIIMAGGRVGIDGIHGATESSMESGKWISRGHVQNGDPYTQKKMEDFLVEARDLGLYNCVTDNGAGGLSSSVGEMGNNFGRPCNGDTAYGFKMDLKSVPLKYPGLDPWQILVSESQERMTIAVPPEKIGAFMSLAKIHGVESTVIGEFTNSGAFHVTYGDKTVAYVDMNFVHEGVPQMELNAKWRTPEQRGLKEPTTLKYLDVMNHNLFLKEMLARPNIAGKEYITRQFDHEVQATCVIKPLVGAQNDVNSDGVVLKPLYGSYAGIALSMGYNSDYGYIDTYHMTANAMDEAIRRIVAVGGRLGDIYFNGNVCWPSPLPSAKNPDAEYKLAQLVRSNEALHDYSVAFGAPSISGKDSVSMDGTISDNEGGEQRISAPPCVLFSGAGKVADVRKCVTMDVKAPGDVVYVLGETKDELGGSEFYKMFNEIGKNVPTVSAEVSKKIYDAVSTATDNGLIRSTHGCYKGGLAVALAQTSFAGGYGLDVDINSVMGTVKDDTNLLYSESSGRFVVTVSPDRVSEFESTMAGTAYSKIGYVTDDSTLQVKGVGGDYIIREDLAGLKYAWQSTFKNF